MVCSWGAGTGLATLHLQAGCSAAAAAAAAAHAGLQSMHSM